jgi:probable HAF family extracellular repeat protein
MKLRSFFYEMAVLLLATSAFAQARYTVTDLGRLSDRTANSAAFSINDAGSIALTLPAVDPQISGQVWNGSAQILAGPQTGDTVARSINYAGAVAGWASDAGRQQACIWTNSQFRLLPISSNSRALAINDAGSVAGEMGSGDQMAFLWDAAGGVRPLGLLSGATASSATAVNSYQEVVGFATNVTDIYPHRAFVWTQSGGMRPLLPKFSGSTVAFGISDAGVAVGYAMNKTSWKAFVINVGTGKTTYYELPVLDQRVTRYASAYAVNRAGKVVGEANTRAFVIDNGVIYDLNSLIAADSGWLLSIAYSINAGGQIVGVGKLNGEAHGFLLTPLTRTTVTTAKGK